MPLYPPARKETDDKNACFHFNVFSAFRCTCVQCFSPLYIFFLQNDILCICPSESVSLFRKQNTIQSE